MNGTLYRYAVKDNLHDLWHKFALNIIALHEPQTRPSIAKMVAAEPHSSFTYVSELYPFRAADYLHAITDRFNATMLPTNAAAATWASGNLTSQYLYLDRRRNAYTVEKACTNLLEHLHGVYGIAPKLVTVNADMSHALTSAQEKLQHASNRLGVTQNFIEPLARIYTLTALRQQVTAPFAKYSAVVDQTPKLFTEVEASLRFF